MSGLLKERCRMFKYFVSYWLPEMGIQNARVADAVVVLPCEIKDDGREGTTVEQGIQMLKEKLSMESGIDPRDITIITYKLTSPPERCIDL
jgi:hypothetical protein